MASTSQPAGEDPAQPGTPASEQLDAGTANIIMRATGLARRWHERAQADPDAVITCRFAADSLLHVLNGIS